MGHLLCDFCRQSFEPRRAGGGTHEHVSAPEGNVVVSGALELQEEKAPIRRFQSRSVVYVSNDPECEEQLEALGRLEAENRRPGVNVTAEAEKIATHPELREWLKTSDQIAGPDELKGRADLFRQRRFGILRSLEGEDKGFPIHAPLPRYPLPAEQGFWMLRLRDELEWLLLPVYKPTRQRPYARPVKDRLNHREARAILDWKASRLDMWLADRPHLVGGRLAMDASRGVLFDTEGFVRWVYALMN